MPGQQPQYSHTLALTKERERESARVVTAPLPQPARRRLPAQGALTRLGGTGEVRRGRGKESGA